MNSPQGPALAALFDSPRTTVISDNEGELWREYGERRVIPSYVSAYPFVKHWLGRKWLLFRLASLARNHSEVVELGRHALNDKSAKVREEACAILAYSLSRDALPDLRNASLAKDQLTREAAIAAIDAITHQNHHYFIDRAHTGTTFWVLNDSDGPSAA